MLEVRARMLAAQLSVSLPLLSPLPCRCMHPRDFFEEGPGRCVSRLVVAPTSLKRLSYDVFGSWATDEEFVPIVR